MAEHFYQLGMIDGSPEYLGENQKRAIGTSGATPPDVENNIRAAHLLPTVKNIPSRERFDIKKFMKHDPSLRDLAVGDIIYTHAYGMNQAIMSMFMNIYKTGHEDFGFEIVKVPSALDTDGVTVIKDLANLTVVAGGLNGNTLGENVGLRYYSVDDRTNTDIKVDNGYREAVAGDIGIRITSLPDDMDACTPLPVFTLTIAVEDPCYKEFVDYV